MQRICLINSIRRYSIQNTTKLKQIQNISLNKQYHHITRKSSDRLLSNYYNNYNNSYNYIHSCSRLSKEPDSKVDKAVDILKEDLKDAAKAEAAAATPVIDDSKQKVSTQTTPTSTTTVDGVATDTSIKESTQSSAAPAELKPRLSLWQRIVHECKHYYNGFKLLYLESKIMFRSLWQVLHGHTLTRRERKQLTTTAADLFRLVPFSLFIIVPFLEFTLPIFLKLFPNMLPSTFQEASKEQEKLKKKLKAKLEMAKFLQDTLEETALTANDKPSSETMHHKFAEFMKKVRSKGEQPTTEEILKYSSFFENELTLDNLNRQQLIALCQILEVSTYGNIPPNDMLRFQLRMKIRDLESDDKLILNEGVENLTPDELQQACRERGMRALGIPEIRLRKSLEQWLDLHLNRKIPLSLLILSRALYLPENLAPEQIIKNTISALPQSIENATMVKIAEASGSKVDNTVKLELLKKEDEAIKLEKQQVAQQEKEAAQKEAAVASATSKSIITEEIVIPSKEQLIDKAVEMKDTAPKVEIKEAQELLTPKEMKDIGQIIENLAVSPDKQVKEDLDELKKDVTEYKEDLREVEKIVQTEKVAKIGETKSAKILSKRVDKLIKDMDKLIVELQKDEAAKKPADTTITTSKNMVSIDEIIAAIHQIQGVSNEIKEKKISQVLQSLDKDQDGKIDDLNDVVKVFELIAEENVKVSKDQLGKILTLLEKEKMIEIEEQQQKQQQQSEKQSQ